MFPGERSVGPGVGRSVGAGVEVGAGVGANEMGLNTCDTTLWMARAAAGTTTDCSSALVYWSPEAATAEARPAAKEPDDTLDCSRATGLNFWSLTSASPPPPMLAATASAM